MKNFVKFISTLKPDGAEYKKITYWNRFYRTKTEAITTLGLALLALGYAIWKLVSGQMTVGIAIICLILVAYPFLVISQFNASIRHHLKNRDPAESAPCEYNLMENGILMDVPGFENAHYFYKYEEFTSIYLNVFGFFMLFKGNVPVVVLRRSDIPAEHLSDFEDTLVTSASDTCRVAKF